MLGSGTGLSLIARKWYFSTITFNFLTLAPKITVQHANLGYYSTLGTDPCGNPAQASGAI